MKLSLLSGILLAGLVTNPALSPAQTPSFQGLGQKPGSTFAGGAYSIAISGDGSTIMGYGWVCTGGQSKCNSTDMVRAYIWTVPVGLAAGPRLAAIDRIEHGIADRPTMLAIEESHGRQLIGGSAGLGVPRHAAIGSV